VKGGLQKRSWVNYLFQKDGGWWRELFLFPLFVCSYVYGVVMRVRPLFYKKSFFTARELPCKVVSVGNITLGGTGKTPLVAALAQQLQKRGMKVGILSRGYKGKKERSGGILTDGKRIFQTPTEAGDEPFMLATMLSDIPVLVGKKRYEMGIHAYDKFALDVLILDDGFQHLMLKRDVDIVLIDARNSFGNGYLFPRGPLREPLRGLHRASALILTKVEPSTPLEEIEGVLRCYAPSIPLYHSRYTPRFLREAATGKRFPPHTIQGKKVFAFAGIADPEYFMYLLKELGADVVHEIHFPDHYAYDFKDIMMMQKYRTIVDLFVTTEKDFVKLQGFPLNDIRLYILDIEQEIVEKAFYHEVFSSLTS
jgi:tetraacyldisaccharide 4'-kinase